jgi:hypothetical protein
VDAVVPARSALSGFSTTTWILVVSMFAVRAAVAASGLLYRLALWSVARGTGFVVGQVMTLGVSGLVLGAAVPTATSRIALVASAMTELAEALGYQARSRPAAGVAMATMASFGQMAAPFLTSSSSLALACVALSLVLRWQAAVPLMVIALSPVAKGAGIDLWVVAIVTLTASNTFFPAVSEHDLSGPVHRQWLQAVHPCASSAGGDCVRHSDGDRPGLERAYLARHGTPVEQ